MPELLQLRNVDDTYELFPNGHSMFLTPSAIKTVNRVRKSAVQYEYSVLQPYVCAPKSRPQISTLALDDEAMDHDDTINYKSEYQYNDDFDFDDQNDINDATLDEYSKYDSDDVYMVRSFHSNVFIHSL